MLRLLAAAVSVAALAAPVLAAQPPRVTRVVRPATQPATRPVATVTEDAQAILDQVAVAYGKLETLELAGNITFQAEQDGRPQSQSAPFTSTFAAPNRFRHQAQDQPLLGSTGEKLYGYSERSRTYLLKDIGPERLGLADLPPDHREILADQNLSLVLAMAKDPALELKHLATTIDKVEDQSIDGKPHAALRLMLRNTKVPLTLLFDPQTHLLRRSSLDVMPMFAEAGRKDFASALVITDYTTITPGAAVKDEQFAWTPPSGARAFTPAVPAPAGEMLKPVSGGEVASGKAAPDFALNDLEGNAVKLSDLKGSVVIIDFWATWCGPCRPGLQALNKLNEEAKPGLKIYAVNLKEDAGKINPFLEKQGLKLPVLLDSDGAVAGSYGVTSIPHTVVVGKDGLIKKVQIGFNPAEEETFRTLIEEQLKGGAD